MLACPLVSMLQVPAYDTTDACVPASIHASSTCLTPLMLACPLAAMFSRTVGVLYDPCVLGECMQSLRACAQCNIHIGPCGSDAKGIVVFSLGVLTSVSACVLVYIMCLSRVARASKERGCAQHSTEQACKETKDLDLDSFPSLAGICACGCIRSLNICTQTALADI
jgi:hypothetical protein